MPSTRPFVDSRCEKCHAVCGQRRICVICNKRVCSYCASDWKKLKRKACIGLCARTAYARLKNPPKTFVFVNPFIKEATTQAGKAHVHTTNTNPSQPAQAM